MVTQHDAAPSAFGGADASPTIRAVRKRTARTPAKRGHRQHDSRSTFAYCSDARGEAVPTRFAQYVCVPLRLPRRGTCRANSPVTTAPTRSEQYVCVLLRRPRRGSANTIRAVRLRTTPTPAERQRQHDPRSTFAYCSDARGEAVPTRSEHRERISTGTFAYCSDAREDEHRESVSVGTFAYCSDASAVMSIAHAPRRVRLRTARTLRGGGRGARGGLAAKL